LRQETGQSAYSGPRSLEVGGVQPMRWSAEHVSVGCIDTIMDDWHKTRKIGNLRLQATAFAGHLMLPTRNRQLEQALDHRWKSESHKTCALAKRTEGWRPRRQMSATPAKCTTTAYPTMKGPLSADRKHLEMPEQVSTTPRRGLRWISGEPWRWTCSWAMALHKRFICPCVLGDVIMWRARKVGPSAWFDQDLRFEIPGVRKLRLKWDPECGRRLKIREWRHIHTS